MIEKFREVEERFQDIERRMSDPEVIADKKKYQELARKHTELSTFVEIFRRYSKCSRELEEAKTLLTDPDMREVAKEEVARLSAEQETLYEELQILIIPKDPDDHKNAIVEIRSGTGGQEAALFAEDLYRMYTRFAEKNNWKIEILSENLTDMGGIKEVVFVLSGKDPFAKLKFEIGTHRVQRVPATEASGRIHTSAATVAVLPEAEEIDIDINPKDLRIDTYRASGAGGQHVNKTSSAVRITHLPTNTVVACQDERSQLQNRDKAMRLLRAKLYEVTVAEQRKAEAQLRKSQVGSGDRSEKIRTYNFPQGRVTDHRINFTVHNLDKVLDGDLSIITEALAKADRLSKMQS